MFVCVWCRGWPPQRRLAFIVLIIYLWCWWLIHNKGILLYQHWSFFTFKYQPWFNFDDFLGLWHVYLSDFYRRINHQFRSGLMEFVGICQFLWPICLPCNSPYLPKWLPFCMIGRIPFWLWCHCDEAYSIVNRSFFFTNPSTTTDFVLPSLH